MSESVCAAAVLERKSCFLSCRDLSGTFGGVARAESARGAGDSGAAGGGRRCIAVTKDGTILCVYKSGKGSRKDISLARFTWGWLYRP